MGKSNSKAKAPSQDKQDKKNTSDKDKLVHRILQHCIKHERNIQYDESSSFQFISPKAEDVRAFLCMAKNIETITLLYFFQYTECSRQFKISGLRVQDFCSNGIMSYLEKLSSVEFQVYNEQQDSKKLDEVFAAIRMAGFEKQIIFDKRNLPLTVSDVVALQSIKNRIVLKLEYGILKMDSQMEEQLIKLSPNLKQMVLGKIENILDKVNVENSLSFIRAINQFQELQKLDIFLNIENFFFFQLQYLRSSIKQLSLSKFVLSLKVFKKVLSNNLSIKKLTLFRCTIVQDPQFEDQIQLNDKKAQIQEIRLILFHLNQSDQNRFGILRILRQSLNLKRLFITHLTIDDKFIQKITMLNQLQTLCLQSGSLSDRGLIYLLRFKNIETVQLYNIDMNSRIVQRLSLKRCNDHDYYFNFKSKFFENRYPNAKRLKENIGYSLRISNNL